MASTIDQIKILKLKGNQFYKNQNYDSAISQYESALSHYANHQTSPSTNFVKTALLFNIAQCHFAKGNFSQAVDFYNKTTQIDSTHFRAMYKKTLSLEKVGRIVEARLELCKLSKTEFVDSKQFSEIRDLLRKQDGREVRTDELLAEKTSFELIEIFEKCPIDSSDILQKVQTLAGLCLDAKTCFDCVRKLNYFEKSIEFALTAKIPKELKISLFDFYTACHEKNGAPPISSITDKLSKEMISLNKSSFSHSHSPEFCLKIANLCLSEIAKNDLKRLVPFSKTFFSEKRPLVEYKIFLQALIGVLASFPNSKKLIVDELLGFFLCEKFDIFYLNQLRTLVMSFLASLIWPVEKDTSSAEQKSSEQLYFSTCKEIVLSHLAINETAAKREKGLSILLLLLKATLGSSAQIVNDQSLLQEISNFFMGENRSTAKKAAEILALSASNQTVRMSISQSDLPLFFDSLLSLPESDAFERVIAFNALSKLYTSSRTARENLLRVNGVAYSPQTPQNIPSYLEAALKILKKGAQNESAELVNYAVEAISFLSFHLSAKQMIVLYNSGEIVEALCKLYQCSRQDGIRRFGICQAFCHFALCAEDYKALERSDAEIDALKEAVREGLKSQKGLEFLKIGADAGTEEDSLKICKVLSAQNIISVLSAQFKSQVALDSQLPQSNKNNEREDIYDNTKVSLDNSFETKSITHFVAAASRALSRVSECRGLLVQQGAVGLVLDILEKSPQARSLSDLAANALAKLLISTNPALLSAPQRSEAARVLANAASNAAHELYEFEALMALTNLASFEEEERNRMFAKGAWDAALQGVYSENFRLQRVAVELLCNLAQCAKGLGRLETHPTETEIIFHFCKSEDAATAHAAVMAMAYLSEVRPCLLDRKAIDVSLFEQLSARSEPAVAKFAKMVCCNFEGVRSMKKEEGDSK